MDDGGDPRPLLAGDDVEDAHGADAISCPPAPTR
jgi:hypothetical protein